jgi:hypothetical protein
LPPKKETGKVQPKKETVRINLPPKPTAAPTIKLPTLPPGGPTGAPSPTTAATVAPSAAPKAAAPAPAAPKPPSAAAPAGASLSRPGTAAPAAAPKPAGAPRPAPAPSAAASSLKTLDKVLIYACAVTSLAAVGIVVWVFLTLKDKVDSFVS